ncbi:hypothetical protein BGAL_0497g00040 [Botrytis galanthina]|uniref:Cyanovirin-N domain-containing protein n=1 Tax=Botrytis galanthina TaxID=278940 RepID=A0A4S8QLA8_9HELO|nr:hypothetical protein BGAL_0497g00040 [Botrytis galanthina]
MHALTIFIFGFKAARAVFGTPIPKLPTSSGNITAYSNNAHIRHSSSRREITDSCYLAQESHLSKRSLGSNEIIECPEGFAPRDGSKIVTCVSIHLKLEKND